MDQNNNIYHRQPAVDNLHQYSTNQNNGLNTQTNRSSNTQLPQFPSFQQTPNQIHQFQAQPYNGTQNFISNNFNPYFYLYPYPYAQTRNTPTTQNLSASNHQEISSKQKRVDESFTSNNKKQRSEIFEINTFGITSDGSSIKFTLKDGKREGEATRTFSNGDLLKFTYKDGKREGEATRTSSNGDVLKFTYKDNKEEGEATRTYNNGDVTKFTCKNGKEEGEATRTNSDGSLLKFTLKDGKREGEATRTSSNGDVLKFAYKDNKEEGEATRICSNGDVTKFTCKNGKEEGEATQTCSDGTVRKVMHKHGIILYEAPIPYSSLGVEEFDDESKFQEYKKETELFGTFF